MKKSLYLLAMLPILVGCVKKPDFRWSEHKTMLPAYSYQSEKFKHFNTNFDYEALNLARNKVQQVIENKGNTLQITNAVREFTRLHDELNEKYLFIMTLYYGSASAYQAKYIKAMNAINEDVIFYESLKEKAAHSSDDVKYFFFNTLNDEEIQRQIGSSSVQQEITKLDAELTEISDDFSIYFSSLDSYKTPEAFDVAVEAYVNYVKKANQLANLGNCTNYLDYAYANIYNRDYSPQQGLAFAKNLKESLSSVNLQNINPLSEKDGSPDYVKLNGLIEKNFNNNYCDGAELFDSYADYMGKGFKESYNDLWRDGYYYFSSAADSLGTAYVLYDPSVNYQIAFFSKENQNISSVVHEFGHYFALHKNSVNYGESYDILETHSQANEYVFANYVKNNYQNKFAKAYGDYSLIDDLSYLVDFSFIIEVENYAYNAPDLTKESLGEFINNLSEEYKNLNIPATTNYWMYPCICSAAYYISYATSSLEAMQFYVMDLETSKNTYFNFCLDTSKKTMVEKWTNAGLKSPFEKEASELIINYIQTI